MTAVSNNSITVAGIGVARARKPSIAPSEASSSATTPASVKRQEMATDEPKDGAQVASMSASSRSPAAAASPAGANESSAMVHVASANTAPSASNGGSAISLPVVRPRHIYENSNLDEITLRQLHEDIDAYQHDLNFCTAMLEADDLTPQEMRTFQLRRLDLAHQIRHCEHRIEKLRIEMRGRPLRPGQATTTTSASLGAAATSSANGTGNITNGKASYKRTTASTPAAPSSLPSKRASTPWDGTVPLAKRPNLRNGEPSSPSANAAADQDPALPLSNQETTTTNDGDDTIEGIDSNNTLQRLGYWQCRLCEAPKYLLAGSGRTPAQPCKWPLKDISKMITHFTDMHAEHTPAERCVELGGALDKNRGPFEYWLRRTRAQNVGDGSCIDEAIGTLVTGKMPLLLRRLSRAAAGMPA